MAQTQVAHPIKISLLHATRGRPERAIACRQRWLALALNPETIEHIFAIDPDDVVSEKGLAGHRFVKVEEVGKGCVGAWNLAASISKGDILVQLSDDWIPVPGWDWEFQRRIRDASQPAVLRVSDGHRLDDLLCMAIFTRPWLDVIGTFLHPDYFGVYSDDEFSYLAYRAGVVIDARDLVLEHDHPSFNSAVEEDDTYRRQNSSIHYQNGRATFLMHFPEASQQWLHEGTVLRYFLAPKHDGLTKSRVLTTLDISPPEPSPLPELSPPPETPPLIEENLPEPAPEIDWKGGARRAFVLLTEKKSQALVYQKTAETAVKILTAGLGSFWERRGLSADDLKRARAFAQSLADINSSKQAIEDRIEAHLQISGEAIQFMKTFLRRSWGRRNLRADVVKSLREQWKAQKKWWGAVKKVVHSHPQEPPLSRSLPLQAPTPLPPETKTKAPVAIPSVPPTIPVYIISFNQITYLQNMVRQLRELGVAASEINVVDNQSTFPPMLDYLRELEEQGYPIHRMKANLGPRGVLDPESGISFPEAFALTDPDLQFHPEMPTTFREDMWKVAVTNQVWKCGCAMNISEHEYFLDGTYFEGQTIAEWEARFWTTPIGESPLHNSSPLYRASIDTTFAVYIRDHTPVNFYEAVRIAGVYEARHLPWYRKVPPAWRKVQKKWAVPTSDESDWYSRLQKSSTTSSMKKEPAKEP